MFSARKSMNVTTIATNDQLAILFLIILLLGDNEIMTQTITYEAALNFFHGTNLEIRPSCFSRVRYNLQAYSPVSLKKKGTTITIKCIAKWLLFEELILGSHLYTNSSVDRLHLSNILNSFTSCYRWEPANVFVVAIVSQIP